MCVRGNCSGCAAGLITKLDARMIDGHTWSVGLVGPFILIVTLKEKRWCLSGRVGMWAVSIYSLILVRGVGDRADCVRYGGVTQSISRLRIHPARYPDCQFV